jgi:hypothetical protein
MKSKSFKDRLLQEAEQAREQAKALPLGLQRDALLKKASRAETAARIEEWLGSPGLRPPKSK